MKRVHVVRGLVVAALLSALVYAVMAALSDYGSVSEAISDFPPAVAATMVALTLGCFLLRAIRYHVLLRMLGVSPRLADSVYLQFSGMTMTVTPGKVGELLKARLAMLTTGLPVPTGVASVVQERIADVIAVLALSALGTTALGGSTLLAIGAAAAIVALALLVLRSRRFEGTIVAAASRIASVRPHGESLSETVAGIRTLTSLRRLGVSVGLATAAWGLEGIAFVLAARELGGDLSMTVGVSIYAISTLAGALSLMPGGIGLTEASLAGLLVAQGMDGPSAAASTMLVRLVTMWFGVALGWGTLSLRPRLLSAALGFLGGRTES